MIVLNLTAVPLGQDGEPVDTGQSFAIVDSISVRLGGHKIGRVPRDEVIMTGGAYQVEESVAGWLARKLASCH
jgi:hypothetical protein